MSTIKDVAIKSKTSVGTVSRYLNGYILKESNRIKIEDAISELNFTLNPIARGLKTNKTNTIGVLIPGLSNVFSLQVISGMEKTFEEYGYNIIVSNSSGNVEKEKEKLRLFKANRVDGIILMPVSDLGDHIIAAIGRDIPLVLIDRLVENIKLDGVISDNVKGSYNAVEHIIMMGHSRIGVIAGQSNVYTSSERLKGYSMALKDYKIETSEDLIVYTDFDKLGGENAIEILMALKEPPTAIFASNYYTTLGAVKALNKMGIKIGEDISLFGYDQSELNEVLNPPLSVVVQPMDEIGHKAAELLIRRMKNDQIGFPTIINLKNQLVLTMSIKKIN
ncbi:LacI family DNA-binding transcriptional regulator [Clostridium lacusfryxellense]|uniref:LacI family DNA-binding transcriptional regulator n=1 Tax=Clostridium lacusfryxellense TaxID=205328 RepID=UPI001C0CBFAB|nr:LacI family DNA-binding transcriptional regulator [Clostridium lacusfryxellense]MBU3112781.1 LacI family transcriptional regulator [Clostridium lacusfryxellense]